MCGEMLSFVHPLKKKKKLPHFRAEGEDFVWQWGGEGNKNVYSVLVSIWLKVVMLQNYIFQ